MKRLIPVLLALTVLFAQLPGGAEETVPGIREFMETQTPTPAPDAFRFRDGIRWGMNPQQVKALESEAMTERTMQDWSIMLTNEKVAVSRFTADLVFMFRQDRLLMITYEFQRQEPQADYAYLAGALSSVYGEKTGVEPMKIKNLMDAINPNRYRTEAITEAWGWMAPDGTSVYLYYFSPEAFAVMYVSPELGSGIYQTNGLRFFTVRSHFPTQISPKKENGKY